MTTEGYKMKSWADHCSSDEESDDGLHPARLTAQLDGDLSYDDDDDVNINGNSNESIEHISITGDNNIDEFGAAGIGGGRGGNSNSNRGRGGGQREDIPLPQPIDLDHMPPEIPTQGPFTAYISNLCYKIETPDALAEKIEGLTKWRYKREREVKVVNARLGMDHQTKKRKGFGYVEFGTPEDLLIFLNLNDGYSTLNGRAIHIDIAKNSRGPKHNNNRNNNNNNDRNHHENSIRGSGSDIDGSKFRGGRYSKYNNDKDAPPLSSSQSSERRSLKLAPRTKPVEGRSASNSNIFGAAKPRDEQKSWRGKKGKQEGGENEKTNGVDNVNVDTTSTSATNAVSDNDNEGSSGRGSGRGGRGRGGDKRHNSSRGRGGRGNGRTGRRDRKNNNSGKDTDGWDEAKASGGVQKQQEQQPQQQPAKAPVTEKKETKKGKPIANSFAALGFDSDSD